MSAKRKLFTVLGIVAGFALVIVLQRVLNKYVFPSVSNSLFDNVLTTVSNEMNKTCPFYVDAETRLDNTVAQPGNILCYNYTLINMTSETTDIEELQQSMAPRILNTIRTNPDMQMLRDHNVSFQYVYKDIQGVFLFKIIITPAMYNSPLTPEAPEESELPTNSI